MTADIEMHAAALATQGYTVIEDFLSARVLAEVRASLAPYLGSHLGRNRFEGQATERIYTLVARARVFWDIVLDARILALCERCLLPNCLLTASQAISIGPGEAAQPLHHDDSFHHLPRPRAMISLSTIVAVDAFTADNGATRLLPGSHLWGDAQLAGLAGGCSLSGPSRSAALEAQCIHALIPAGACPGACRTLGRVRVGAALGRRLDAKRSRAGRHGEHLQRRMRPKADPTRRAEAICSAIRRCRFVVWPRHTPHRRLVWHRNSPRRGPDPKSDRLLVFAGTLVHGGGANRSQAARLAFSNQYCQPWARPQENFILGVPIEVARAMPTRLQELLGYSVHPPFIGQLTAAHPAKALAPNYENRVVAQARAAAFLLPTQRKSGTAT